MCEPFAPGGVHVNVGVDLEQVDRFRRVADDPFSASTDVLFTADELAHADTAGQARAERLTGTWCAKEATVKALWPWVRLDPRRVSVVRDADGRPEVVVSASAVAAAGLQVRLSISHAGAFASAVAVAWGPPPEPAPDPVPAQRAASRRAPEPAPIDQEQPV